MYLETYLHCTDNNYWLSVWLTHTAGI